MQQYEVVGVPFRTIPNTYYRTGTVPYKYFDVTLINSQRASRTLRGIPPVEQERAQIVGRIQAGMARMVVTQTRVYGEEYIRT